MEKIEMFLLQMDGGKGFGLNWIYSDVSFDDVTKRKETFEREYAKEVKSGKWKFRIVRATTTYEVMEG